MLNTIETEQTILIVEDDVETNHLLLMTIRSGMRRDVIIMQSFSGGQTLDWLNNPENPTPDVVILDLSLPDMDGQDLFKIIHKRGIKVAIATAAPSASVNWLM
jgi:DNA-binding NtrC family response regulator